MHAANATKGASADHGASRTLLLVLLVVSGMCLLSYGILGFKFRLNELALLVLCVSESLITLNRANGDYLAPGFYFPLIYYLFYWVGNFDFLGMYQTVPDYIWNYYLVGAVFLCLGIHLADLLMTKLQKRPPCPLTKISRHGYVLAVLLFCICVVAKLYMYTKNGIPLFSSNIDATRESASENFGLLKVFTTMLVIFPAFFFYDFVIGGRKSSISLFVIFACVAFALLDTSRLLILQMFAPMILLYIIKIRRIKLKTVLIVVVLGLLFIGANKFMRNVLSDPQYLSYITQTRSNGMLGNIFLSGFDSFRVGIDGFRAIVAVVPLKSDYTHGMMFANSLLSPLPGKQMTIGFYSASLLGLNFDGIGLATTLLGMFYLDWGYIGIAVGMLAFGALLEFNYKRYVAKGRIGLNSLFSVYLIYFSVVSLRTGVLPTIEPVLMFLLYWFIGWIMGKSAKTDKDLTL